MIIVFGGTIDLSYKTAYLAFAISFERVFSEIVSDTALNGNLD